MRLSIVLLAVLLILCMSVGSVPAMTVPSSDAAEKRTDVDPHAGGSRPEWASTFGYVSVACAAVGVYLLVDSSDKNNDWGVLLLLPGIAWLTIFAR